MPRVAGPILVASALVFFACSIHSQVGAELSVQVSPNPAPHHVQPYTAEFHITNVQTLADGTTITHEGTEMRARNSAGITMIANSDFIWQIGPVLGTSGGVHDTDGTILANWGSVNKTGHIFKMPPGGQRHGCWQSPSVRMEWGGGSQRPPDKIIYNQTTRAIERIPAPVQGSRPQVADLGTLDIQGVPAHGRRITRTVAVGEADNDHTIVTVDEDWIAPSLGISLRQSIDDPRTGKRTRELVSLSLGEPDASLFQPPADYQVTTEELHPVACADRP